MDIDLKDRENGIQISTRLREIDPDVCLVFITNLAQYAIQGYRVNAFDYIVKPINEYDFNQRIASISKMIEERKKEKIMPNRLEEAKLQLQTIIREAYGNNIKVFSTDIPRSVRAAEISAEGKSIFQHDPKGKVAEAYRVLTKEVLSDAEKRRKRQLHQVR